MSLRSKKVTASKVCILGGGTMGAALARLFLARKVLKKQDLLIVERDHKRAKELQKLAAEVHPCVDESVSGLELLIIACKPQDFAGLAEELRPFLRPNTLLVSIMAGSAPEQLMKAFPANKYVACAMPNLALSVGQSFTAVRFSPAVSKPKRKELLRLLAATGVVLEVPRQNLMHATTSASASGCGFFFAIIEHYIAATQALGFSKEEAESLVRQTLRGTLALWESANSSPADWRARVTSKRGTTHAGLKAMKKRGASAMLKATLTAAYARSRQLSRLT